MNWLESILYGLISGITEFLPLSSYGHQQIFMHLCGENTRDPAMDFFIHIALLISIWSFSRPIMVQINRDRRASKKSAIRNTRLLMDHRFIQKAIIPMLILYLVLYYIFSSFSGVLTVSIGLLINGIILFLPTRVLSGNKDSRLMSPLDAVLLGLSGALSAFPGVSRIGTMISFSTMRGAERKNALQWALLLSMHAIGVCAIIDLINLFAGVGISSWGSLFNYISAGVIAYFGGYLGINFIRFISEKQNNSILAFYSWGASLFAFIIYLTVI